MRNSTCIFMIVSSWSKTNFYLLTFWLLFFDQISTNFLTCSKNKIFWKKLFLRNTIGIVFKRYFLKLTDAMCIVNCVFGQHLQFCWIPHHVRHILFGVAAVFQPYSVQQFHHLFGTFVAVVLLAMLDVDPVWGGRIVMSIHFECRWHFDFPIIPL